MAGFLSSILDEITTLLFLANITLAITHILGISSLPFLISEIIFANIGGLATYIGTPVDIMIGSAANLNFYDFIYHMTPISLILITVNIFYLVNLFKDTLKKNNIPIEIISHHLESTTISVLWWALALGANIGANGTLIGTASNLIVADIAEKNNQPIPFWYFVRVAFPLVVFNFFISLIYVYLRYLS